MILAYGNVCSFLLLLVRHITKQTGQESKDILVGIKQLFQAGFELPLCQLLVQVAPSSLVVLFEHFWSHLFFHKVVKVDNPVLILIRLQQKFTLICMHSIDETLRRKFTEHSGKTYVVLDHLVNLQKRRLVIVGTTMLINFYLLLSLQTSRNCRQVA